MNLIQKFLTQNDCYKLAIPITPKHIIVHSTGVNNPRISRYADFPTVEESGVLGYNRNQNGWNHPNVSKMVHFFIGKLEDGSVATCQVMPTDWKSWNCGSGPKGSYNSSSISWEICEDGLQDRDYFEATYKEAKELAALMCKQYNLDPLGKNVLLCHKEVGDLGYGSKHVDITHWWPKFGKTMDDFRQEVNEELQRLNAEEEINNMDQQTFNTYMDQYLVERAQQGGAEYMKGALEWARKTGVMVGDESGNQMPMSFLTRGDFAVVLRSYTKNVLGMDV